MLITLGIDIITGKLIAPGTIRVDDGEYPLPPDLGPARVEMDGRTPCFVEKVRGVQLKRGQAVACVFGKQSGEFLCWTPLEWLEAEPARPKR